MIKLNDDKFFSPAETADLLGISKATLWNWVKQEKIKKITLSPKKVLFSQSEIFSLLK